MKHADISCGKTESILTFKQL